MPLKIQAEIIPEGDFFVTSAERIKMSNGKSVEEAVNEAGGVEQLTGNTSDTTPKEVVEAIAAGKNVFINHSDMTYGVIFFSNFAFAIGMNIVASSVTFESNGVIYNASLTGDGETNIWSFAAVQLATLNDIPEEKIATDVDLSKYESEGIIVETYADGSILTHNFEFDDDGRPTKRTDSDGNVQTITW